MTEQNALRELLKGKLVEIQKVNPAYSLRAFAKKISLTPGALSGILHGKRKVSRKLAIRIVEKLQLDDRTYSELISLFPLRMNRRKRKTTDLFDLGMM